MRRIDGCKPRKVNRMKRLIEILGSLKRMSGVMHDASKNDSLLVGRGKTAVPVNGDWLEAAAKDLSDMADELGEFIAERCKDE